MAGDPGLMRLRLAIRASGTAAIAALVLSSIAGVVGQPSSVTIVGTAIAMLGTVVLSDATLEQEQATLALVPLVVGVMVVLATFAARSVWASTSAFCVVIFCAVYVRRYGPRATALGVMAFLGYFFALYFNGGVASIRWTEGAIVVGVAIAYVVRFTIVRERPQRVLEHTLRAFDARARVILDDLAELAVASDGTTRRRISRRIQRGMIRLNETALALEDQVGTNQVSAATDAVGDAVSAWVGAMFARELAVETLADAIRELSGAGASEAGRRELVLLARGLREIVDRRRAAPHASTAIRHLMTACDSREPPLPATCRTATRAVHTLAAFDPWPSPVATGDRALSLLGTGAPLPAGPATISEDALSPTMRLAIQATIAGALSMVAGRQISEVRWFWAVIAAFVVFIRATTIGETLSRAWQRTLGTVGGVVGGLVAAQLVGRDPDLALALIFVGLFGAYYFYRVSYAWMIGFLTTVIALIYTVLGRFSRELLYIRVTETLVGALIGTAVAAFVFPAHSSAKLRVLTGALIRRVAQCIVDATRADTISNAASSTASSATTVATRTASARTGQSHARDTDRALQTLWQAALPLMGQNTPVAASPITRSAHNASALVYALRQLTSSMAVDLPVGDAPLVDAVGRQLADACIAVADALEAGRRPVMPTPRELVGALHDGATHASSAARSEPVRWLERIDRIVTDLVHTTDGSVAARTTGARRRASSGGY